MIYFDNAATTKPSDFFLESELKYKKLYFANPSSSHKIGYQAKKLLDDARARLCKLISRSDGTIYFTGSGTIANNIAIYGMYKQNRRILTTNYEHPSVYNAVKNVFEQIDYLDFTDSIQDADFASIMHVNNETGITQDLSGFKGILHSDCVQSFGKLKSLPKANIMTFAAHKIGGCKGLGAIFVANDVNLTPFIFGGGQENALCSGTQNLPSILAFADLAEKTYENIDSNYAKVDEIRQYLKQYLIENVNDVTINESKSNSPYILSVTIKNVLAETLMHALEEENIYVSTGSACASNAKDFSKSLLSLGRTQQQTKQTIRLSFSPENSLDEAKKVADVLKEKIEFLRSIRR